jgi:hypothetical protein
VPGPLEDIDRYLATFFPLTSRRADLLLNPMFTRQVLVSVTDDSARRDASRHDALCDAAGERRIDRP